MKILSSEFQNNTKIPVRYTRDSDNVNPPLDLIDIPENAMSLILIMDDPDAPSGTWVHWVIWNIDPKTDKIAENSVPAGAIQGATSRENHYSGPYPPSGTHRYFFKLYALDTRITLLPTADVTALSQAMDGHILAQAKLIGLYR